MSTFQEKIEELKITAEKILQGKSSEDSLPVYSKDFNDLLEALKDIEVEITPVSDIIVPIGVDNIWNLSGAARQSIVANTDKNITIENPTDSIKSLHIIHSTDEHTITIGVKDYIITGDINKVSVVIANFVGDDIYLSDTPETFTKINSVPQSEFPTANRIGLWKMSSINATGGFANYWDDSDGGGLTKRFVKLGMNGPTYSPSSGISFINGQNLFVDPDGLIISNAYTMYALVRKTGDGGLFMLYAGPYFFYITASELLFKSNAIAAQVNSDGIANMSDYKVIALTFPGGTDIAKAYVDGVMVNIFVSTTNDITATKLYGLSSGPGEMFDGYIKGFTFFTGIHTPLEIATNSVSFKALAES